VGQDSHPAPSSASSAFAVPVRTFFTIYQGRADARQTCGWQAAADLTREPSRRPTSGYCGQARGSPIAGQRTGRRPLSSPLLGSSEGAGRRWFRPREGGETMTTRAAASAGNEGGLSAPGASAKAAPLSGGSPAGAASRRLAAVPRFPGPVVARRYATRGTSTAQNSG
jgi:hypothetical protein